MDYQLTVVVPDLGPVGVSKGDHRVLIVVGVHGGRSTERLHVGSALSGSGFLPRFIQCRKKHGRQNCDDRNYDEKFNKSKFFFK